ncbi:uncharacterized protein LOC128190909 [Crassostrea angulata]|uniref:uncharacterized protein LOC128190909 n=1 Tax=Magallana angulata TaxID=2784310 RepID=UPI0022B1B132|nr:uncharacterized protein LOC128190909 [Crassostrea angulata]
MRNKMRNKLTIKTLFFITVLSVSSSINTTWIKAMRICENNDERPTKTMDIVETDTWIGEAKYKLQWGEVFLRVEAVHRNDTCISTAESICSNSTVDCEFCDISNLSFQSVLEKIRQLTPNKKYIVAAFTNIAENGIRGVYIDLAEGYDTGSFIVVFRRFVSIRGNPKRIISDAGTQLVAAGKEPKKFDVEWNVIKSADAPWENGCSESLIKQKWHTSRRNLERGDLVLVQDTNMIPGKWKLAQVTEAEPGKDEKRDYSAYKASPEGNVTRYYEVTHAQIPIIPQFSGDEPPQKGDVTYKEWKYEVQCLINDPEIKETTIIQSIRTSLRRTDKTMLLSLLDKLNILFGEVSNNGMIMQEFFNTFEFEGECATSFGCRLESMLQNAIDYGYLSKSSKNDLLRHKFWTSLSSERLKSQTRHKYDTLKNYDHLLLEIRKVEKEITINKTPAEKVSTDFKNSRLHQHDIAVEDEVEEKINKRIENLQTELKGKIDDKFNQILHKLDASKTDTRQSYSRGSSHRGNINSGRGPKLLVVSTDGQAETSKVKSNGQHIQCDMIEAGISTDPEKVSAVVEWPRPTNIKGYYRRFVENFAKIVAPLNNLLRGHETKTSKKAEEIWKEEP